MFEVKHKLTSHNLKSMTFHIDAMTTVADKGHENKCTMKKKPENYIIKKKIFIFFVQFPYSKKRIFFFIVLKILAVKCENRCFFRCFFFIVLFFS